MTVPQWQMPEELKKIDFDQEVGDHLPDKIGEHPGSNDFVGYTFEYFYPSGIGYRVSFSEGYVHFSLGEKVNGVHYISLPCRVRQLRPNQYLAHWLTPGRNGHVSLIFDLDTKHVDCAALMPGKFELWDRASFRGPKVHGEGALYNKSPAELPDSW